MESSFVHCTECKKDTENSKSSITHAQKVAKTSMEPKPKVQETLLFFTTKEEEIQSMQYFISYTKDLATKVQ